MDVLLGFGLALLVIAVVGHGLWVFAAFVLRNAAQGNRQKLTEAQLAAIRYPAITLLYLGSSFLLLSLVSMVWHEAEAIAHTGPWWAFGITLGLFILALFGLFERKRNDMLRILGKLRSWEK